MKGRTPSKAIVSGDNGGITPAMDLQELQRFSRQSLRNDDDEQTCRTRRGGAIQGMVKFCGGRRGTRKAK